MQLRGLYHGDPICIIVQGGEKVLGLRKNDSTFTPGNGFKSNVQHYYIILLFSLMCNYLFKYQLTTDVTDISSFTNLTA